MSSQEEPHGCVQVLSILFSIPVLIWLIWCSIIAFVGGTMPIIGLEVEGGLCFGLVWLFLISPIVEAIAYFIVYFPLMIFSGLIGLTSKNQ